MGKPILSIIVPSYNVSKYVDEVLPFYIEEDLLGRIKVIFIDDGATDDSAQKINEYVKKHPETLEFYHKENGGLCDARNYGVKKANGTWITFVDGDDWLDNYCLSNVIKRINKENIDIVLFGTIKDYRSQSFEYNYPKYYESYKIYEKNEIYYFLKDVLNFEANISDVTAKLYKKSFLSKYNIAHDVEIRQGIEAIDFNIKAFNNCKRALFIKEYYYHYTFNENSITNKFDEKLIKKNLIGYNKVKEYLIKSQNNELLNLLYIRLMHNIISVSISGYFNPKIKIKYRKRKKGLQEYLNEEIINESLKKVNYEKLSKKYKILLFLINKKKYFLLIIIGFIRNIQKR